MNRREMRAEIVSVMIHEMRLELNSRPWHIMSRIHAPVTDAHIQRARVILDELERRYS